MNLTQVLGLWRALKFKFYVDLHFQGAVPFLAVMLSINSILLIFLFLSILFACMKVYDSGTCFALHVATPVELAMAPFVEFHLLRIVTSAAA